MGGRRRRFGESEGDVEHEIFKIECKRGKKRIKEIVDALKQARRQPGDKTPLAMIKSSLIRGDDGEIAVMWAKDFYEYFGRKDGTSGAGNDTCGDKHAVGLLLEPGEVEEEGTGKTEPKLCPGHGCGS